MHLWIKDAEKSTSQREAEYQVGGSSVATEREATQPSYQPEAGSREEGYSSRRLQSDTDVTTYLKEPKVTTANSRESHELPTQGPV